MEILLTFVGSEKSGKSGAIPGTNDKTAHKITKTGVRPRTIKKYLFKKAEYNFNNESTHLK